SSQLLKNTETLKLKLKYRNTNNNSVYAQVIIFYNDMVVMVANAKVLNNMVTNDTEEHTVEYEAPLNTFNHGEYSVVALLSDASENVTIADYGYGGELTFSLVNASTGDKIGGAMKNVGTLRYVDEEV